jgi:eukaryotic-like serine/threonine-protein kinase
MATDSGSNPSVAAGATNGSAGLRLEQLAAGIQCQMLSAWQSGSTLLAEQWLDRHPEVKAEPEIAVLVIYEELCLREERGEELHSAEIYERFPQYRDALSLVLGCHRLIHLDSVHFPAAGEPLGEFRLLRELGRGAAGRVFLATQPWLSDRPLVVKLTPRTGDEHLTLARLQHTHIVPLFHVQEFPDQNLRALCMPFLGGASWSAILQALKASPQGRTREGIVCVLDATRCDPGLSPNSNGPALGFLSQASYEQSVCWIGSCLADALHYAHQRGLLHLDIKPSNVLIASDGQPMLLDFHLAHEISRAQRGDLPRIGGTPGYMSPEQQRCMQALHAGRPLPIALDQRSDIYSLGVLLYESLAGQHPPADENRSREYLRLANPQVSRGLADLLHKCLAPDSSFRYASAGELATDLRRHVAHLPLRGVANRSPWERWQKWRKRQPHSLHAWTVSLTAFAAVCCAGLLFYSDRLQAARSALRQAEQELDAGDQAVALERLTTGLRAIRWLPGQHDLKLRFQSYLGDAQRARAVGSLHHLVEQLRFLDNVDDVPAAKLRELDAGCRSIWEARSQLAARDPARARHKPVDEEVDLSDLALLWTRLITRMPTAGAGDKTKALNVLDEAEAMWGFSPALALARAKLSGQFASSDHYLALLSRDMARAAWEYDAVGRSLLHAGELEPARATFEQAIRLEPAAFWPHYHLVLCAYRSELYDEALRSACVCVALAPQRAECVFNRGLCWSALEQNEAAVQDFTRALELDAGLGAAALQRGRVLVAMGRTAEAFEDFKLAAARGSEPAQGYCQAMSRFAAQGDWPAAQASIEQALEIHSAHSPDLFLPHRFAEPVDAGTPAQ